MVGHVQLVFGVVIVVVTAVTVMVVVEINVSGAFFFAYRLFYVLTK